MQDELIGRQAVLDIIEKEQFKGDAIEEIEKLPTVAPQPKTGHWIKIDGVNAICNCCNRPNHLYGTYCKHCGAKMVDPHESCDTCKHKDEEWDSEPCDGCCGNHSGFKPCESEDAEWLKKN